TPLVLHYLEGKAAAQVAQELGRPYGTVLSLRGRDRLRVRLVRRGGTLTTGSLAAALTQSAAAGALPTALGKSTVKTTVLLGLGQAVVPGAATPKAAALAKGVLHAMFLTKVKAAAVVVVAVGLLGLGAGSIGHKILAGKQGGQAKAPKSTPTSAKVQEPK